MTNIKKDWIGSTQNVMATLNASSYSKEEREENDYYATTAITELNFNRDNPFSEEC